MQELRLARREDDALIVTNDAGDEFQITIDEYVISEVKQVARAQRSGPRVKPREIQALIRAGKSRDEVVAATGAEQSDVERHEGPVLAERLYLLENALQVPVRSQTDAADEATQTFGGVITARLASIVAEDIEWTAWRDEETGWMVSLDFRSRDVDHRAVWSFEHRKALLAPVTSDAVTLSQQGDVGDRLIPKLRAVNTPERTERFDSNAFDTNDLAEVLPEDAPDDAFGTVAADEQAENPESLEAAYETRQEIEQRAIRTREDLPADLGQTADLLDALRRRRGERESGRPEAGAQPPEPTPLPRLRGAWDRAADAPADELASPDSAVEPSTTESSTAEAQQAQTLPRTAAQSTESISGGKKRRASIPSWDDILFGTRSEDDPV